MSFKDRALSLIGRQPDEEPDEIDVSGHDGFGDGLDGYDADEMDVAEALLVTPEMLELAGAELARRIAPALTEGLLAAIRTQVANRRAVDMLEAAIADTRRQQGVS